MNTAGAREPEQGLLRGIRAGTGLSFVTTTAKVVPLVLLIVVGGFAIRGANLVVAEWPPVP